MQGSRFKQLASLVVARTTPPEELGAMRQLFESLDVDGSGTISYEKLHKGLAEKCHVRLRCPSPVIRVAMPYDRIVLPM